MSRYITLLLLHYSHNCYEIQSSRIDLWFTSYVGINRAFNMDILALLLAA